ncbi:pentatricopeptide repeat-containing protein At4g13650-like [Gastrolobium bilobum]|uniref:pentatricopeptide repeat-containing protein At4g13650-like n=1 Tax=Gastrolobium bilobum TaxID=150636 RepID=UPI002AAF8B82|nr:pentatricopeptide repeat-containing protein At4g13650-like [Gastrolobium bilobum]
MRLRLFILLRRGLQTKDPKVLPFAIHNVQHHFISSYCYNPKQLDPTHLYLLPQSPSDALSSPFLLNKFLSICAKSVFLDLGIQLHAPIVKLGFCSNIHICSTLIHMYGKCGIVSEAQKLFDEMTYRNAVVWNSLIRGYLLVDCPMIAPMPFTISTVLVACSRMEAYELGIQLHGLCLKVGFGRNVVLGTNLIDMYSRCRDFEASRQIFDHMVVRNVITWTSMVSSYAQNNQPDEAMALIREMLCFGVHPDHVTYNSLLSSFSSHDHLDNCKQIHCRVIREGFEANEYLVVTLMTVYSECNGSLVDFWRVCSGVRHWNQISWNALIAGLSNLGDGEEALIHFSLMREAGVETDHFTFTSTLSAAGITSALNAGKKIHALILKYGYSSNLNVQNGLVSMYARCGSIPDSKKIFSSMNEHDVISWNSLLSGYAHHGHGREVVELFEKMRRTKVKPNNTTFLAVLTACSHVGMVDKGLQYFELIVSDKTLAPPRMEHYATIVDLLGRFGYLHEAESFIDNMPIEPGPSTYKTLLSACQVYGNKEIALRSAEKLLNLHPNDPATYILLSNVLSIEGCWADEAGVRKLMWDKGLAKKPGYSWI